MEQRPSLPRRLGLAGALATLIGSTIGSGIFRSPASIADRLPGPLALISVWTVGGALALCGALTLAEVAGALAEDTRLRSTLSRPRISDRACAVHPRRAVRARQRARRSGRPLADRRDLRRLTAWRAGVLSERGEKREARSIASAPSRRV